MFKATNTHITTRRTALRGLSLAALAAGLSVPAMAAPTPSHDATASDADAELIALCTRWLESEAAEADLHRTIKDDDERDLLLNKLHVERAPIITRVDEIGVPKTIDGAVAMARVGLANIPRDRAGNYRLDTDPETSLFFGVALFLTGGVA